MKHCEIRGWKNGINATCLVSRRSKVGGTQANLLKFSSWWKITAIIGFSGDDGGNTSLHKMSIHSSTPSCKGVNRESDIVDIMYGVESLWTGTATAFISTVHSWRRSSSLNLIVRKKLKIIWKLCFTVIRNKNHLLVFNMLKKCREYLNQRC